MTTLAQEAIAVLLDLAQRGEIDPWDVQVIDAIDRYLSKIGLQENPELENSQADLPQSGQTFLWASMLVLLKANTLEGAEQEEEEAEIEEFELQDGEGARRALPIRLEHHIRRRPTAPPPRRRRVTLEELIEQIQQMAAVLESSPPRSQNKRGTPLSRKEALRTIAQLAHDENLTEVAAQLDEFLKVELPQRLRDRTEVEIEQLLELWAQAKAPPESLNGATPVPTPKDRVGVFWALLLLSAQSKVELSQQEFYQDLTIRPIQGQTPLE